MCDIPKNSEKWGGSKCEKGERLGIVPGTWFGKWVDVIISNIFFMTYYIPLDSYKWGESNGTIFIMWGAWDSDLRSKILHFWFGSMLMMPCLCNRSVWWKDMKFWIQQYQNHVNPSKTDGGMNILHLFLNIKKGKIFISPSVLLTKIGSWYC